METSQDFGLYGILTHPKVGYERLAASLVDHGVRYIQLRMKDVDDETVTSVAERLRGIITGNSRFIVNDNPRIAKAVGADGVHLGQDDMTIEAARAMLGDDAVIGLSTHNPDQTVDACRKGPDYIGVGPVYATPTKRIPDPVIGLDGMKTMIGHATCPAVAIGGIDLDNLPDVLAAGARNVCAVRCINQSDHPDRVINEMIRQIESFSG